MKKLFVTALTLLTCGAAYALPVGNPSDASLLCDGLIWEGHCGSDPCDPCLTWCDAFSVRVGFYGDYVFNRHLNVRGGSLGGGLSPGSHSDNWGDRIEHTEIFTNAGMIVANFWDRFDIFTTLGATNLALDTNEITFDISDTTGLNGRIEMETDTHFSWSIGVRATLWECGCTSLGIESQYFYTRPSLSRVTLLDQIEAPAVANSVYPTGINWRHREAQVGFGISHRINMLVPYIAVKWSRAWDRFSESFVLIDDDTILFHPLRNRNEWGYAVGVSLVDCEKISLCVEGRFGDEKAVHVNGQIRF